MWSFNKIPYHLPKAKGKFVPGVMDVMLGYSKDGLFMRVYYPTEETVSIETNHASWIPIIPDADYIKGLSTVTMLPSFFLNLAWNYSGHTRIPAVYGAKARVTDKLNCIIFSHGLGALRSFYSSICVELASRGYLVAVLEHRDQSSCHTYYFESEEAAKANQKTSIEFKHKKLGNGHFELRKEQVHYRMGEVCKALDFFLALNGGEVPHNVITDVPTRREIKFELSDLVGKIDVESLSVGGHSFGGATALLALSRREEFKQGILLDPWMYPIKEEHLDSKVTKPLIFVNTYTFHIVNNVKAMEPYLTGEKTRRMFTILNSTHESQTDSVFLVGYWLNWFMKKIDPQVATNINNYLILRFLKGQTKNNENIDDCVIYLRDNDRHFSEGLTKAWA